MNESEGLVALIELLVNNTSRVDRRPYSSEC